jgi:pilus assembly protein CpaB
MAADEVSSSNGPVKALAFLVIAVVTGALAIMALFMLINQYQEKIDEAKRPEDTVMVIVAARDLYQGVSVTEEDLYAVEIPPRFLPEGVFLSPDHVVGRIPRERILANEFVRANRLADPESGVGLNAIIPRGMRAISVNIRDGQALSGFLNPGNYVDVLVTIAPELRGVNEEVATKTLIQAVFVLGVNSRLGSESREDAKKRGAQTPSVTLLVTAEQAESLAFSENQGELRLLLRNDLDVQQHELDSVDISDLRRKLEPKVKVRSRAPVKVEEPNSSVIIIRGDQTEDVKTDANGRVLD